MPPAGGRCSIIPPPRARVAFSRFSLRVLAGALAQSVEHRTFNPLVDGSIPSRPIKINKLQLDGDAGANAVCRDRTSYSVSLTLAATLPRATYPNRGFAQIESTLGSI